MEARSFATRGNCTRLPGFSFKTQPVKVAGTPPKIQYISHGARETGGYAHEQFFAQSLSEALSGKPNAYAEVRFRRNFKGFFNWVLLAIKTFFAADRNAVVITVARLAWPVRLKQLLGHGKLLLVLHNSPISVTGKNT